MTLPVPNPFSRLRFVIVSSFTSLNLVVGMLSLFAAVTGAIQLAAWGLVACVLLDGCDGSLARRWKVTTDFGAQLDSLSDMTSFMVAGAVLIFYWLNGSVVDWLVITASGLYALCGALRLARFNSAPANPRYFQGVPTTFAALAIALNYLSGAPLSATGLVIGFVSLSLLMVSSFPYPKVATGLRWLSWGIVPLFLFSWISLSWAILVATVAYLSTGPLISLWNRRK
jgi:CDP-diacylglycerol---serine O-phosphatidyltransferase